MKPFPDLRPMLAPTAGLFVAFASLPLVSCDARETSVTVAEEAPAAPEGIVISSLEELAGHAAESGQTVILKPGVYKLADHLTPEDIAAMREERRFQFLDFSGSDNTFILDGVTIEVDTALRAALRAPIHNPEFLVSGHRNTLRGLTITNIGDGTSAAGNVLSVAGDDVTLVNCTLHVRGSFPYGYGDFFGKGGSPIIHHRKHSGLQITGNNSRITGCKLFMRSFGHGIYIQGGTNHHFEDCHVEGEMRATDDMLAETSGPAFDVDFRTEHKNREGENRILPGYMKSLAEDGFRTYADIKKVTLVNCTAKNMRGGFELRTRDGEVRLENCSAIGNERGFWLGGGAVAVDCRGSAEYGPLLFLDGDSITADISVLPDASDKNVHALATIHGRGHKLTLKPAGAKERSAPLPILVGFHQPPAGEGTAPYGERGVSGLELNNETTMPVVIGSRAENCRIRTCGPVSSNEGKNIVIEQL